MYEHPDITAALATGYPRGAEQENRDTPENRADYIDDHRIELVEWLRIGYPDILDEFIEFSGHVCSVPYKDLPFPVGDMYAPPGKDPGGMDEGEFYMIIYKCGFPMDGPESRSCEEVDEDGPLSCDSCPFGYAEEEDF